MRFNLTPEEERLNEIVKPYRRVLFNPLRGGIDENAPDEVKEAHAKLQKLIDEHDKACREP